MSSLSSIATASKARAAVLVVLAATLLGACDSAPSASERWCEGLCTAVHRCGLRAPTCGADCVTQRPGLAELSLAATNAEEPCLARLSCTAVMGNEDAWKTETDACWHGAIMTVVATDRSRDFCASHARALFDCGYIYTVEECAQDYAVWSDALLTRMTACEGSPSCEAFVACERQVVAGP